MKHSPPVYRLFRLSPVYRELFHSCRGIQINGTTVPFARMSPIFPRTGGTNGTVPIIFRKRDRLLSTADRYHLQISRYISSREYCLGIGDVFLVETESEHYPIRAIVSPLRIFQYFIIKNSPIRVVCRVQFRRVHLIATRSFVRRLEISMENREITMFVTRWYRLSFAARRS